MFSDIPSIFDRHFVIGYFLPMILIVCLLCGCLQFFNIGNSLFKLLMENLLIGSTLLGLVILVGAISLSAINREIIRIFEGYGKFNPLKIFRPMEIRRFNKLENKIIDLEQKYNENKSLSESETDKLNSLYRYRVRYFPDKEKFILPTPFGNTIRAFEVYPRIMYGIESIIAWPRIGMIISDDAQGIINTNKSYMDFWMNLGLLNLLFIAEIFFIEAINIFANLDFTFNLIGFLILAIFIYFICISRSIKASIQWGETIKSAFDVHLSELATKLNYKLSSDHKLNYEFWKNVGIAWDFARSDYLPLDDLTINDSE